MKQSNDFLTDIADFDLYPDTVIRRAGAPLSLEVKDGLVEAEIPFEAFSLQGSLKPAEGRPVVTKTLFVECLGDEMIHLFTRHETSPMLAGNHESLTRRRLSVMEKDDCWELADGDGRLRARLEKKHKTPDAWSDLIRPAFDSLEATFFPDGGDRGISLAGRDQFFPEKVESLPLAFIDPDECGVPSPAAFFAFEAGYDECFAGTGERFAGMDLKGRTLVLENTDGLGVNSRRAYKNVPFYLSSRGYGLFVHTSRHMRLSLADVSTRAAQGRVDAGDLDLYIIGGGAPEPVLRHYRELTGFPPELPLWSYGTWMSRMTYFSAEEINGICDRLRREDYPCDVIHIDTGWFEKDWVCEWTFSPERFPDPAGFMEGLRRRGFRTSLWQTPNIGEGNRLLEEATKKRYLAPPKEDRMETSSDFSGQDFGGQIDFTNPEAVIWYRGMIRSLLEGGASVIKTDFGEKIQMNADYKGMPPEELHNLYGLLYQKAAFEETNETTGDGIIWARAGWAGCQRYPLHWGGDAAATWDGMAGSLRGGLHLGLSGFGFWSHDVPGFHGIPEFMNTPPSDELYVRWTQFGVFSSHLRYHGTGPREPWHFPGIAPLVRKWLKLRYYFIPYFLKVAGEVSRTGYPFLRAMLVDFPEDPVCWMMDDQFLCGSDLLVCPVFSGTDRRKVYVPAGGWRDFWTGERIEGPVWLAPDRIPLERLPLFVRDGACIPVYPVPVSCTDEMDLSRSTELVVDDSFAGWPAHSHAEAIGWN